MVQSRGLPKDSGDGFRSERSILSKWVPGDIDICQLTASVSVLQDPVEKGCHAKACETVSSQREPCHIAVTGDEFTQGMSILDRVIS
mmetsp:Transcript_34746/g.83359  ORF Transcript_34746/g.83359 Transcript_34746/m.83359 type:complete len:87 (+) Transcript_34746:640-900(+)